MNTYRRITKRKYKLGTKHNPVRLHCPKCGDKARALVYEPAISKEPPSAVWCDCCNTYVSYKYGIGKWYISHIDNKIKYIGKYDGSPDWGNTSFQIANQPTHKEVKMEPEKKTETPEKKEFRGKLFVVETPPELKDTPCEIMSIELPGGGKLPKLVMLVAVKESKFGTNMRLIDYLDYKKDFDAGSADVPKDFSIKRLTGRQGHDMTEKLKTHRDIPAWEVVLGVMNPANNRPRRMSTHTLATCIGASDPLAMAEEMKTSKKTLIYTCPDVLTPVNYLIRLRKHPGMIDTPDPSTWDRLEKFFKDNPYPTVRGFKRFQNGTWSGGSFGKGSFTPARTAMDVPFEEGDFEYARAIITTLKSAGFTPGIEDKDGKIIALPPHDLNLKGAKTDDGKVEAPVSTLPPPVLPQPEPKTEAQETAEMMKVVKSVAKSKVKTTIKGMLGKAKKFSKIKSKKPKKKSA